VWDKIRGGGTNGKISFVLSNREPGESKETDLFFDLVRSYNIPLICLSHRKLVAAKQEDLSWKSIKGFAALSERKLPNWANIGRLVSLLGLAEDPHESDDSDYGHDDDGD
jgi:hypothetical protein